MQEDRKALKVSQQQSLVPSFIIRLTSWLLRVYRIKLIINQCLRDLIYADLHKNQTEIWRRKSFHPLQ